MTLARLQELLVRASCAEDPAASLARARDDRALTESERSWLEGVDLDGVRLTGLLVKKLRFESILRGDPELRRRFERDAAAFVHSFEAYLRAEPRRAVFPAEEAARFSEFLGEDA